MNYDRECAACRTDLQPGQRVYDVGPLRFGGCCVTPTTMPAVPTPRTPEEATCPTR